MVASTVAMAADDSATPTATTLAAADGSSPDAFPVYAEKGAATCLKCHDTGAAAGILRTAHAVKGDSRTPFAQHACESCHGASPQHVDSHPAKGEKRASPTVVFKGDRISSAEARNGVCLTCHESGVRMNWKGSQHSNSEVACTDCHSLHAEKDVVRDKRTQPQTCFNCHAEQRADSYQLSHHPIREGKVVCSDCHNPHGSPAPKMLKEVRVTDTCYNCHADKRGPFLWEHQPVREDCTYCHNPHGSINARLLKDKMPWLCSDCHGNNNMGGDATTHSVTAAGGAWANGFYSRVQDRSCTNCHFQIHGSNNPSGSAFLR